MATRSEVVSAGRALIGTPYHLKGRLPNVGIDCIGVVALSMRAVGLGEIGFDVTDYSGSEHNRVVPHCDTYLRRIEREAMQPGDVVVIGWGRDPRHIGLVGNAKHGGLSIIHSENNRYNKVIEHRLWLDGAMKYVQAYAIPGLEA